MKKILVLWLVLNLSACSTAKFDQNVNCSPRALRFISRNPDAKLSENVKSKNLSNSSELMKIISVDLQKCYQDSLSSGHIEEYSLCAVIAVDDKGKIGFIDVDDHSKMLNPVLYKCIMDTFMASDYSKIQSTTLVQPFNLYPRKN